MFYAYPSVVKFQYPLYRIVLRFDNTAALIMEKERFQYPLYRIVLRFPEHS